MARPFLSAISTLAAVTVVVAAAAAQPPGPKYGGQRPSPPPVGGPGVGFDLPPEIVVPDGQSVPDYRLWLQGYKTKQAPTDINPELLKKLIDKLPKDQPADPNQIKDLLEKNPEFKNPAFLNQLQELPKSDDFPSNLAGKLPKGTQAPPPDQGPVLEENFKQVIEEGHKQTVMPEGGKQGDPMNPPKIDPKTDLSKIDPKTTNAAGENEWARWVEKNFGDSPAGQAALKDLVSALEKQDMKGMFDQVPEFKNGAWKDLDSWGKSNAGDLWKVKPPDLSGNKVTPPTIGGGSGVGGGGGDGSSGIGGGGGGAGIGGGGQSLAVIVGIAVGILLAILLLRKWRLHQIERAAAHTTGKAGIDLDAIRTREELVRAFDHVSLDQIGEEARSWNHRVIADQIAGARPAQAEPAGELAGLYERARYAPLDEDLSAGEFADARRDLRVIAGVPA
jgi:hypothetical protein